MKRIAGIFTLLLLSAVSVYAQNVTVKGRVLGSDDGKPIPSAYVIINPDQPNSPARTSVTNANGEFSVTTSEKNITVRISFIGYQDFTRTVTPQNNVADLGTIRLAIDAIVTEVAQVTARAPIASMRGDTLQYNANAFKTNPDASSEDLLKKLPGVTTDDDGNVEVHGQTIGKIYIDGKEFFADDPNIALKTLPADVVENLQIFDDQSDEARFSGFDDGERIKAINIVTKEGVSTSTFGKVFGGYGTDDRYAAGVAANIFNLDQRLTIIGQRNNVNNQGFTLDDIASSMNSRRPMGGGIDASQFTTSVRGGIQTTTMAGLNYQGEFKNKLKIGGSYFFNNVNADQHRIIAQNFFSMPRDYYDTTAIRGYNYQHRVNVRMEWNPNETNRIFITPRLTYSTNHGYSHNASLTFLNGVQNNSARNDYSTRMGTYDAGVNLWWMHRFTKPGRTLSLGGSVGGSNGWGYRTQDSDYGSIDSDGDWISELLKQYGKLGAPGFDVSGRITFAEAISKSSRLQWSYNISHSQTDSRKLTYNWDYLLDEYDFLTPDEITSNVFQRDQTRHRASMGYNLVKEKVVLNTSVNYQYTHLNDDQTFPNIYDSKYNFSAVLPRLRIEYKPQRTKTLMLEYNRNTSTPSVNQLQDVIDLTNPLQVYYGNPGLKQSYSDVINIRYNTVNTEKSTNFNIFGGATFTQKYIANHRRFLTEDEIIHGAEVVSGAQVRTPVNLNGYIRTHLFTGYGFSIPAIRSNMNIHLRHFYSKLPAMENNELYRSRTNDIGMGISLTSNISENVDFTVSYRPSLNISQGSTGTFERYIRSDLSGFLNIFLWKGLFINADATWRNRTGTQESFSQHYAIVNAAIGYKFLKFRQAEIRISGNDLLNQNRSYWTSTYDTYIQSTTSSVLKRYYMASFTYKFDTRKNRNADNFGTEERGSRAGNRGPGGPGGGAPPMGGARR